MREDARKLQADYKLIKTLTEDADKGDINATYKLGMIYFDGYNRFLSDYEKGIKYLTVAQKAGSHEATYKFGEICQYGVPFWKGSNVVEPNRSEALIWYKNAAANGYEPAIDKMKQYKIAENNPIQLADSLIAKGNYNEALRILKIATEYNYDKLAMYKISQLYLHGNLTGYREYQYWLSQAAEHYYIPSFRELADVYEKEQYEEGAMKWYREAGTQGDIDASKKYNAYYAKNEEEKRINRAGNYTLGNNSSYSSRPSTTQTSATETRKTCPVCNGTGKITDRYTSEKRDWDNKTITMTDHATTKQCSRCNGKGYYTF